jgi:hypothetical protein
MIIQVIIPKIYPCISRKIVLEFFVVGIVIVSTEKWELPTFLRLTGDGRD